MRVREGTGATDRYVMPARAGDPAHLLAPAPAARAVPVPESTARPAAVAQSGLAPAAPRRPARAPAHAGDAAHRAPPLRDASARGRAQHPRDPGAPGVSLAAHHGALCAGVARPHWPGAQPPRHRAPRATGVADDGAPRARRLLRAGLHARARGRDDRAGPRRGRPPAAGALPRATAGAARPRRLSDARPGRPPRRVRTVRFRPRRVSLVSYGK